MRARRWFFLLAVIIGLVIGGAEPVLAQAADTPELDELLSAPDEKEDASVELATQLLGEGWQYALQGGWNPNTLIGQILMAFNVLAMALAVALAVYTALFGAYGTAAEGELGGRDNSMADITVRQAVAIGALSPIPGLGASAAQGVFLVFLGWSITAANYVWGEGLDYLVDQGGAISSTRPDDGARKLANGILRAQVLRYYTKSEMDAIDSHPPVQGPKRINAQYTWSFPIGDGGAIANNTLPDEAGKIELTCGRGGSALCRARRRGISLLIDQIRPHAVQMVEAGQKDSNAPEPTASMEEIIRGYEQRVREAAAEAQSEEKRENAYEDQLGDFKEQAGQKGWAWAGAWYFTFLSAQERMNEKLKSQASVRTWNNKAIQDLRNTFGHEQLEGVLSRLSQYENNTMTQDQIEEMAEEWGRTTDSVSVTGDFIRMFTDDAWKPADILGGAHPFLGAITMGQHVSKNMIHAISLYGTARTIVSAIDAALGSGLKQYFTFGATNAVGEAAETKTEHIGQLIWKAAGFFFLAAFVIGWIVPAIPFMYWFFGLLTWVKGVIEVLIAVPIWMIMHMIPEGRGFVGRHARRGYLMAVGVFFRPALMTSGFLIAAVLASAVTALLGDLLGVYYAGVAGSAGPRSGIVSLAGEIFVTASILTVTTYCVFGLIEEVPSGVMKMIGGIDVGGDSTSAESAARQSHQGPHEHLPQTVQNPAQAPHSGGSSLVDQVGSKADAAGQKAGDKINTGRNSSPQVSWPDE